MARPFFSTSLRLQRSCVHHTHTHVHVRGAPSLAALSSSASPSSIAATSHHIRKPLQQQRLPPITTTTTTTTTATTTPRQYSTRSDRERRAELSDTATDTHTDNDARLATDFEALDVYADIPAPATSVETCLDDGFVLNNGTRIEGGDGCVLVDGEAFKWRPWRSLRLREGSEGREGIAAMLNDKGQFEMPEEAWGLLRVVWPKPDLLIIGLGQTIHPLSPKTRESLALMGMRVDVQDSRNAAAQYNLLATERGPRDVAAALIPLNHRLQRRAA